MIRNHWYTLICVQFLFILTACQTIGLQQEQNSNTVESPTTDSASGKINTYDEQATGQTEKTNETAKDLNITQYISALKQLNTRLDGSQYEYANIPTLYPDDLWLDMRKLFSLDIYHDDPRVKAQYNWYSKHPSYMTRVSNRSKRYIYYVVEQLKKRNMPGEIALLPIVESAYDPFAYSHGRASGMWQFIPGTGKIYGLKQDWWYDGRRDVIASTDAALDYLQSLSNRFGGDWLLALAAYNSGGGTVSRAIRHNKQKGLPTDFWSLSLPKETSAYVPKLLALSRIVWDTRTAGVSLPVLPKAPYFAAVDTGSQIDLAQAAELAEVELDELYLLNPGFNQWATSPDGPHRLLVPIKNAELFEQRLSEIPVKQRVTWSRYTIKSGDTLSTIAEKFGTTIDVIRNANHISNNIIVAGKTLMIPSSSLDKNQYTLSSDNRLASRQSYNPDSKSKTKVVHIVETGDSFWEISRKYKVGTRELAKWNGMAPTDTLRVGQELVVWVDKNHQMVAMTNTGGRNVIRKVGYKVRSGDSLSRIASRFNVTVSSLRKWNSFDSKYLQPGDYITIYVDVTSN
ncbi:LysM peptidoglycan-binding domain-containing protein [Gynuella sp.]|uniref:lytic transglycosylase n=1 Tax=Gynuella sp. TaxID=2969146 RepID=UPI003D13CDF2